MRRGRPPRLLADAGSPLAALRQWIDLFVDLLVTKHGLADTVQPGSSGYASLRTYFIDRLMPVAGQLLDAAVAAGEIRPAIEPYELMRGIGNPCLAPDPRCDPRKLIALLLAGLQHPEPSA